MPLLERLTRRKENVDDVRACVRACVARLQRGSSFPSTTTSAVKETVGLLLKYSRPVSSRDSVLGTATCYRVDGPGFESACGEVILWFVCLTAG